MSFVIESDQDRRLREDVREFLNSAFPPERQIKALDQQHHCQESIPLEWEKAFWRELAARGWLGLGIPAKYGGSGGTALQRHIVLDEISYVGAPYPKTALTTVAPALLRYGSEFLRRTFLPIIAGGISNFCFGYTEPGAGTDLASLRTRAVRDGDHYVVTGQKIFTTRAHRCDYCWLAVRTQRSEDKHDGISLLVLDLRSKGVEIAPIPIMDGGRTNMVFLDAVRVPAENLVGEEHRGWEYLGGALGLERIGNFPIGHMRRYMLELVRLARSPRPDGRIPVEFPAIRHSLGEHHVDLKILEAMIDAVILKAVESGEVGSVAAAKVKVHMTELKQRMAATGMEMLGRYGQLSAGADSAPLNGMMEQMWLDAIVHTFGAGANEVQRDNIARRGLGLPRNR